MKTQTIDRDVAVQAGESHEFTIKANGKAFRALISTLYENKIQSIVREIWSNALDSHVDAGTPELPFSVSFPTVYNPVFIVRDYGISLNHEQVMRLYTTVFESTKEDSNDVTGKFGLGSKSPFAYTDTFSVVAVQDGMKRHYSAVIGSKGIPSIHFLGESETDEPRGIEVSFPIKNEDIRAFRRAAQRVSHGFAVKPEVLKHDADETEFEGWPELDVLLEGDDWKILNGNIEGYSRQAYAKMGPVLYPINVNAIENLPPEAYELLQTTILIEFDMGQLEMTPSREALSYGNDEPTVGSIRTKIIDIVTQMLAGYQARYDACGSYWDACCQYVTDMTADTPAPIKKALAKAATWNGKPLVKELKLHTHKIGTDNYACLITGDKLHTKVIRFKDTNELTLVPHKDTLVFIEDIDNDKRAAARIKYEIEQRDPTPRNVIWIKGHTSRVRAKRAPEVDLLEFFNGAEFILVEDLDFPPKATYARNGVYGKRPVAVRQMASHDGDFDIRLDMESDDFQAGGYFVPLERNELVTPAGMMSPLNISQALMAAGVIPHDTPIYGAPKTLWKRFEESQWVNLYDFALEAFNRTNPKASVSKHTMIEKVLANPTLRYLNTNTKLKELDEGPLLEALTYRKAIANLTPPDVRGYLLLARAVGKEEQLQEWKKFDDTELEYHLLCIRESYPLIEMFQRQCEFERDMVDKLHHYVQVCDKAAKFDSEQTVAQAA